ncbi:hypothetical protein MKW92_038194 [Papaver armeniacum]|nr:hypothetical protein MKW92_038194 [Papaver armeniacum]
MNDIPGIQACDFLCFPEEDPRDSYYYKDCIVFWPKLFYVLEDQRTGGILGYVIAKMVGERHGYISYLGVHPTGRKQGIAKKLMTAAEKALVQEYGSEYVSVHVRRSSVAAINLFTEKLGYQTQKTAAEFYDNGEDAYVMRKQLQPKQAGRQVIPLRLQPWYFIETATMVGQTRKFQVNNYN